MSSISLSTAVRAGLGRLISRMLGEKPGTSALPILTGPAKGLWFREESLPDAETQSVNRAMQMLQKICKVGWTVWDSAGESGYSTILFSRFVGDDGLVVSFEPERTRFLSTFDNATLNGCHNIMFLFSELGVPAPAKTFGPPIRAKKLTLDEVYRDDEIPIPQIVSLNLEEKADRVLEGGKRLLSEKRPILVVHRYDLEAVETLKDFAGKNRYKVLLLDRGVELSPTEPARGSLLVYPE